MESENVEAFERRKRDHITQALDIKNEAVGLSGLNQIRLIHEALPDLDFTEINIQSQILGHSVGCPIFISSMTAGHPGANSLNLVLAEACEARGWAMGVGSQRRELFDPNLFSSNFHEWRQLRVRAPRVVMFGNIGISQVIATDVDRIRGLVDSLGAQGMIVHLNALQECIQPEGTPNFRGGLDAIAKLVKHLGVPVIVKETGSGMSSSTIRRLMEAGVHAVDVSGLGGTHWGRIEGQRLEKDDLRVSSSEVFSEWGISTVDSVMTAIQVQRDTRSSCEVWASGGVRTGLDAAKLLAMGAISVGVAKPALQAALKGKDAVVKWMQELEHQLRVALFCTGSQTIQHLRERKPWTKI